MSLYKIGIVGYGVVGKGIHKLFKEAVAAVYDPHIEDLNLKALLRHNINLDKDGFSDLDLVVVSVPTNEKGDWSADTEILWESLKWLDETVKKDCIVLIKSTTPPSKLLEMKEVFEDLNIVYSPEYMGESKYYTPPWKYPHPTDMESHTWQIFGGDPEDTTRCVDIFKRRMGVDTQFWQTDIKTASLSKYMVNSFFAMKVTFVNEWFDIAEHLGVDWNQLRELWLLDPRVNRNHTLVFPRDRGYGGKCFPKDTRAIMKECEDTGYISKLMMAMDSVNQVMRGKNDV